MSEQHAVAAMPEAILRLDRINTFYGPIQVHFDLTIEVGRGQIVCLLGGNASGKSTTMKVILGLTKPRSGAVILDGRVPHAILLELFTEAGIGTMIVPTDDDLEDPS